MVIRRDTVVIVDVESTCWENHQTPPGQISEIIEIGVCTLEIKSRTLGNKRGIFVIPTESTISDFCSQLTTITPQMLDKQGIDFDVACAILKNDYATQSRLWMSWGNYDRRLFQEQCARRNIDYPFSDKHCNLKNLFANFYGRRMGMAQALKKIGLPLEGAHHRGADDAQNIGRILSFMLDEHSKDLLDSFWE